MRELEFIRLIHKMLDCSLRLLRLCTGPASDFSGSQSNNSISCIPDLKQICKTVIKLRLLLFLATVVMAQRAKRLGYVFTLSSITMLLLVITQLTESKPCPLL